MSSAETKWNYENMSPSLRAVWLQQLSHPPPLQCGWRGERWYRHRFRESDVVEGAIRDDEGRSQGTIILEVTETVATDSQGHWIVGKYICASDPHMTWWMTAGEGKKLAAKCYYHFCEGSASDCTAVRRGKAIHIEKFRVLTQKEVDNKVPAWAYEKEAGKAFQAYLKKKDMTPGSKKGAAALPWVDPGEEESDGDEEETTEESSRRRA